MLGSVDAGEDAEEWTAATMKVSFFVPAYNEARTIAELIEHVSALPFEKGSR